MRYLFGYEEEFSFMFRVETFDGALVISLIAMACVAAVPGWATLWNIRSGTSEVIKLKLGGKVSHHSSAFDQELEEAKNRAPMSLKEIKDYIYGKDASLSQMIFAAFY